MKVLDEKYSTQVQVLNPAILESVKTAGGRAYLKEAGHRVPLG